MAMGQLERIADYANMISQRMSEGQTLDSWMYSQITLAVDQLNSVHDAMDGDDGVKEPLKK
jgi:phosphate uptake regulator